MLAMSFLVRLTKIWNLKILIFSTFENLSKWCNTAKLKKFVESSRVAGPAGARLDIAIGPEVWGLVPGQVKSDTVSPRASHRCDVS